MTTDNNKHIITNEIVLKRQLYFSHITFSSLSEVPGLFNISSTHANTNLTIRRFSREQFLISKYSSILPALLHSQWHVLVLHM